MRKLIVVIDDEPAVANVLASFLKAGGYEVRIAHSGSEGVRLVRELNPGAVVCDMRMPDIGGEEVVLMLKSAPSTCHIPVVMVTGYCDQEFRGMGDAFLPKPLKCRDLLTTVQQLAA